MMFPFRLIGALLVAGGVAVACAETPIDTSRSSGATDSAGVREFISHFEVLITAPRQSLALRETPAATTVVGEEWLGSMPQAISVDEALKLVPGVRIDNQATGKRVHMSIRGQGILTERGIRGIKVLLDGLPLNDPSGFAPDFYDIDWSSVSRVEVLRGPAAALYGGGSSGGVLAVQTKVGGEGPVGAELFTVGGSHNFWKGFAGITGSAEDVGYGLTVARITGDGYRVHTRFNGNNFYGKVRWDVAPSVRLTPVVSWTKYFNENAEGLNQYQVIENPRQPNPDALTFNEFQNTERFTTGVSGKILAGESHEVGFTAYFRHTIFTEPVPSSVLHRSSVAPGGSVQYDLHMGKGELQNHVSIGSDLQWQTIEEYRRPNEGGAREGAGFLSDQSIIQRGAAAFLIDRLVLGPEWSVTGSLRYDDVRNELNDHRKSDTLNLSGSANFRKTTARIGAAWTPFTGLNLYANWGQGFLPPATEELANNPDHLGGFNTHLTSATSRGEELGVRGTFGETLLYDAAGFILDTEKDFGRYRMASRPLETFYGNLGSSHRLGFEAYLAWFPVRGVTTEVAYTYSHFKYSTADSINGNWLPNSPAHQLFVNLEVVPVEPVTIGASVEVQSRWYVDQLNIPTVGGFTIFAARAAYRWRISGVGGEICVSARNIFGRHYIAFSEPDPDGNSYQPGPTQELFFGVKINL